MIPKKLMETAYDAFRRLPPLDYDPSKNLEWNQLRATLTADPTLVALIEAAMAFDNGADGDPFCTSATDLGEAALAFARANGEAK